MRLILFFLTIIERSVNFIFTFSDITCKLCIKENSGQSPKVIDDQNLSSTYKMEGIRVRVDQTNKRIRKEFVVLCFTSNCDTIGPNCPDCRAVLNKLTACVTNIAISVATVH
ncbi:hypothetical protein J6590_015945 [Homalodisca vitripennis]|nr:hypothetical protein J6590_015945 [Homalodisca vitripennis]